MCIHVCPCVLMCIHVYSCVYFIQVLPLIQLQEPSAFDHTPFWAPLLAEARATTRTLAAIGAQQSGGGGGGDSNSSEATALLLQEWDDAEALMDETEDIEVGDCLLLCDWYCVFNCLLVCVCVCLSVCQEYVCVRVCVSLQHSKAVSLTQLHVCVCVGRIPCC